MIHFDELVNTITVQQAIDILTKHTARGGIFIDLDRSLDYWVDCHNYEKPLLKRWRDMAGDRYLKITARNQIMDILVNRFGVPKWRITKGDTLSIDKDTVESLIQDTHLSEDVHYFMRLYRICKKCQTTKSSLKSYINAPLTVEESFDGNRMTLVRPKWSKLNTYRISGKDPGIQTVARLMADIITRPKGMIQLFADSGQIEPRITYSKYLPDPLIKALILLYNDAYFGMLHYILMEKEELTVWTNAIQNNPDNRNLIKKMEITEEIKDKRQTLKKISLMANYGSDKLADFEPTLATAYINRIVEHPLRKELEQNVHKMVSDGIQTFYTAFGDPITPGNTEKYKVGSAGWYGHIERCAINNPIQGTASNLMIESVYTANNIITQKAKGSTWIGFYKHDEGMFYIDEKDEELIPILSEVTAYQVQDWIPIYADAHIGKKSGSDMKEVLEEIDSNIY